MARLRRRSSRRATVLIEMALVLPLLVLFLFGMMEYGWIFLNMQHITTAARHGARMGVKADATSGDVTAAVASVMSSAGLGGSGYMVSFSDPAGLATGAELRVTVAVTYANIELTGIPVIPVPATLRSGVTMAKEGPG